MSTSEPLPPSRGTPAHAEVVALIRVSLGLTTRQAEVALGIASGLSQKAIAGWLGMPRATVRAHISGAYARTRHTGIRGAVQLGIAVDRLARRAAPDEQMCSKCRGGCDFPL
jgi:DNA-binding NarL/FixJ family response regulator